MTRPIRDRADHYIAYRCYTIHIWRSAPGTWGVAVGQQRDAALNYARALKRGKAMIDRVCDAPK